MTSAPGRPGRPTGAGARVVLVTGVSRYLGARVATALQAEPDVERVVGVDTVAPRSDLGRAEFVRVDLRNPLIAKVVAEAGVDTVVHLNLVTSPTDAGGRSAMKEINVIGTMQLLAACQKAPGVRRLVVRSTTAVYGSSPRAPAVFGEEVGAQAVPRRGYARDAADVEGYVRGFGRRRPDVALTVLRLTNLVGPRIDSLMTRYLSLPVVPTALGYDPRLQLLHEDDAVEVLREAALADRPGTFNVGGEGVVLLSQATRRAGRLGVSVSTRSLGLGASVVRRTTGVDVSPEQLDFLLHGRVVDTARLREHFDRPPRRTTLQALDDFVRGRGLRGPVAPVVRAAEHAVADLLDPPPPGPAPVPATPSSDLAGSARA